jgi:undecaprenyl-diphosphatase
LRPFCLVECGMDILLIIKTIIMGLVEGATEFLPISSTGHLIIAGDLLNFLAKDKRDVFEIFIQLGAILAVCWEYRARLTSTLLHLRNEASAQGFLLNLFIAFLPAALVGLAFHKQIKTYLFSPITVACALIVGGFAILLIEKYISQGSTEKVEAITAGQALKIGLAQTLALFPGVSRAGATILGGIASGLNRQTATEFSFFLAIPIMFAATGLELLQNRDLLTIADFPMFALGFVTAFLSALLVIRILIRYVANHDFTAFAWYRIVFGLAVLAYYW